MGETVKLRESDAEIVGAFYSGIRTLNVLTRVYATGQYVMYQHTFPRTHPRKSLKLWEYLKKEAPSA